MVNIFRNRFVTLLVALLVFFILDAFIIDNRLLFGLLSSAIVIFCLYAIEHNKKLLTVVVPLAALSLLTHWLATFYPYKTFYLSDGICTTIFLLTVTGITLNYVIKDKQVTVNTLCGAISGYLLLGLIWTFIYTIIAVLQPQAFAVPKNLLPHGIIISQHFIYYSFVTISTLGYGDITPLSNPAKVFSWLEAVTGQIYLTIWIAHLVGMYISKRNRDTKNV